MPAAGSGGGLCRERLTGCGSCRGSKTAGGTPAEPALKGSPVYEEDFPRSALWRVGPGSDFRGFSLAVWVSLLRHLWVTWAWLSMRLTRRPSGLSSWDAAPTGDRRSLKGGSHRYCLHRPLSGLNWDPESRIRTPEQPHKSRVGITLQSRTRRGHWVPQPPATPLDRHVHLAGLASVTLNSLEGLVVITSPLRDKDCGTAAFLARTGSSSGEEFTLIHHGIRPSHTIH